MFLSLGSTCLSQVKAGSLESFVPTDIPNMQLWLDASDASTITEVGGNVSQWDDKSGNNVYASQAVGSKQPSYGTDVTGGFIEFTGTGNAAAAAPNFLDLASRINGKSVYFIADHDGTDLSMVISTRLSSGNSYIFLHTSGYAISMDGAASDVGSWYMDGTFQATGGNVGTAGVIGSLTRQHTVIFSNGDPRQGFDLIGAFFSTDLCGFGGKIREVLVYDEYHSTSRQQQVQNYLMSKWGIS